MSNVKLLALMSAVAIGGAVTMAEARGPERMPAPDFATLDADGDGQVTVAELEAHRAAMFAEVDTDGDGGLSAEELATHAEAQADERRTARMAERFEQQDENGDGVLQPDEMGGRGPDAADMVERLDADGDGAISAEEFEAAGDRDGRRGDRDTERRHGPRDRG